VVFFSVQLWNSVINREPHVKSGTLRRVNQSRFTRQAILLLVVTAAGAAFSEVAIAAGPNFDFFAFNSSGANLYSASAGGVLANMTFSTTGDDTLFLNPVTASASQFVTQFGAAAPGFNLTNGTGGSERMASLK
jgi:hypothetical protein